MSVVNVPWTRGDELKITVIVLRLLRDALKCSALSLPKFFAPWKDSLSYPKLAIFLIKVGG